MVEVIQTEKNAYKPPRLWSPFPPAFLLSHYRRTIPACLLYHGVTGLLQVIKQFVFGREGGATHLTGYTGRVIVHEIWFSLKAGRCDCQCRWYMTSYN